MATDWIERDGGPCTVQLADDLAGAHLALWLAGVLPSCPTLVWAASRALAETLAADRHRPTVWLEPDEGRAAEAMRKGRPGLRVVHAALDAGGRPDVDGLDVERVEAVVIELDRLEGAAAILARLLPLASEAPAVALIGPPELGESGVADALLPSRPVTVVRQRLLPASTIGTLDGTATEVAGAGSLEAVAPARAIALAGPDLDRAATASVLLADAPQATGWQADLGDVAAMVAELEVRVDAVHQIRLDAAEQRWADAAATLEACRLERDDYRLQLDLVHRSRSWRVTAPLRRVTDLIQR